MVSKPRNLRTGWRILSIVFGLVMFWGCSGIYSIVSFEILEPATVDLPEEVEHVTILNRTPLSVYLFDKRATHNLTDDQLYTLDTLINNNILRGLNEMLKSSDVAAYKTPLWYSIRRLDTNGLDIPLTKIEVNNFCREYGSDAIVSLEYYGLNLLNRNERYDDGTYYSMFHEAASNVKWNIYLPGLPLPFNEYTTSDTMFFEYFNAEVPVENAPSSADIVRAITFESGMNYGRYLVPTWTVISRKLYKGREKILRETANNTNRGDWDLAYATWDSLITVQDSTLAAKAAYNMAVFHELEDDLDKALDFVQQSQDLNSTDLSESYIDDLEVRILNRKQVIKQVGKNAP